MPVVGRAVRLLLLITGTAALTWLAADLYHRDIASPESMRLYPSCWFNRLTGLHCSGCGATRAVHALLHFQLRTAVSNNLLLFVLGIPVFSYAYLSQLRYVIIGQPFARFSPRIELYLIRFAAVSIPMFWVVRNFPWWPFTLLAPIEAIAAL